MIKSRRMKRAVYIGYWWESQRQLGRPRHRWVDIKMDLR
jgi:hypothetical protein